MVTWRLCAAGQMGPVFHMGAGKALFLAFAVPLWARGKHTNHARSTRDPSPLRAALGRIHTDLAAEGMGVKATLTLEADNGELSHVEAEC